MIRHDLICMAFACFRYALKATGEGEPYSSLTMAGWLVERARTEIAAGPFDNDDARNACAAALDQITTAWKAVRAAHDQSLVPAQAAT